MIKLIKQIKSIFNIKEGGIVPQKYIIANWRNNYFVNITHKASIKGFMYSQKYYN